MKRFARAWLPVAGMCLVIYLFSRDSHSLQHSQWVLRHLLALVGLATPEWLERLSTPFRKFAHLSVYAMLAVLTYRALVLDRRTAGFYLKAALETVLFCAVYAASDEFHQAFVPGRTPSVRDVLIDVTGAVLALIGLRIVIAMFRGKPAPPPAIEKSPDVVTAVSE